MRIQGLPGAYRCTRMVSPLLVVLALAVSTVSSSTLCGRWDPAIRRREGSGPGVCVSPRVASGFPERCYPVAVLAPDALQHAEGSLNAAPGIHKGPLACGQLRLRGGRPRDISRKGTPLVDEIGPR
jgi:hypothetical protein